MAESITNENVSQTLQNDENVVRTDGAEVGSHSGLDRNTTMNKGVVYPIIRINDHYCSANEIVSFSIESGYFKDYNDYKNYNHIVQGFVPTMSLILKTTAPDLLKLNAIKCGDICAVFCSSGGGLVKSYRGDFIITSAVCSEKPTERVDIPVTFIIKGELNIPSLRNEQEKFNFNGTTRDAIIDAANKLGLGFFFCDPEDTDDYQGWQCTTNLLEYVEDVAAHSWKEFNAFYDCWIDPRYGISFLNINKLLGEDGFDEPLDLTPFVNTINSTLGIDGKKGHPTEQDKKDHPRPQTKLLTNIPRDDEAGSPFYIKSWNLINRASEICNAIGINSTSSMTIDNPGMEAEVNAVDMNYSIPINQTKLQNGFFILIGPGVNLTYTQADQVATEQSYVKNSYTIKGGEITEAMSNDDAEQMKATGGNMYSSGNTNRFYDAAYEHNMRNNLQLQKQILAVECQGLNLAVMRGEKIPVLIMDNDRLQASARIGNANANSLQYFLYELACGWYIIDGIIWEWSKDDHSQGTTLWKTKMKLVRREWPIPGKVYDGMDTVATEIVANNNEETTNNNYSATQATDSPNESSSTSTSDEAVIVEDGDNVGGDVPLTGLSSKLKEIYMLIADVAKVKLVSAKRWAVDENGKRTNGNAYVTKNGLYKCMNAKGDIMYFTTNNSMHLYGQAFDIINGSGESFEGILQKVAMDNNIIKCMINAGVAMCIESTTDDSGVATQHYHVGTENAIQKAWWDSVLALNGSNLDGITRTSIEQWARYNAMNRATEIKRNIIEETSN